MGFKATEAVEELTYDFNPHVKKEGVIPEPSSKAIENYRDALVAAFKSSGLNPEELNTNKIDLDQIDSLMEKSKHIEDAMLDATADLTGLAHNTLQSLPYRIKRAFVGWVMGLFYDPEG